MTDDLLLDFVERRLPAEALSRIQAHAAKCADCRVLVSALARVALEDSPEGAVPAADPPSTDAEREESSTVADPWTPPDRFDEFRIERLLGRGAMGAVYLAHDDSLDRKVAIKFLLHRPQSRSADRALADEARALAKLQHPNVVGVFRAGQVDDHPYIVSEFVDGKTLEALPLPVPWRRVLSLGLGLSQGLAAAHRSGLLHRDVKPSNVLITPDGTVKLVDFGLAERFDPSRGAAPRRSLRGTPRYMAPELRAGGAATPQGDVFAVGAVLYELLMGDVPSGGDGPPPLPEGLDPDFARIVRQCLAPDPASRFDGGQSLCEALEQLERTYAQPSLSLENPYRGLAPFEAEHRELFFGRDRDVRNVIERLNRLSMVLVAGDSGMGKSSLCRAGVIPRLTRAGLGDGRELIAVTLWPGRRPLEALSVALAEPLGRSEKEVEQILSSTQTRVGALLREALPPHRALLIFVDQLEELVTQSDRAQAARFAAVLGELAVPSPNLRVLLAVRGDFFTRVSTLLGLGEEAERALYLLHPMSPEGIREAVVGPARSRGVVFESGETGPDAGRLHGGKRGGPAAVAVRARGALGAPRPAAPAVDLRRARSDGRRAGRPHAPRGRSAHPPRAG